MRKFITASLLVRFAVAFVAIAAFAAPATAGGLSLAYAVLTNADVDKVWKKAQGKLMPGFNVLTPEFKWLGELRDLDIEPSLREMTFPVDLLEDRGITSLPEGGREAEPMSQNAVDATVAFIHLNGRFTVSKRARWALAKDPRAGLENQLKFQGKKKMEAMARVLGDLFYGYSNGYLCQTSTAAAQSSGTYTLKNMFGDSDFSGATAAQARAIADKIRVGDRVALIRAGALVANAIGTATAVTPATPSVAVTWNNTVTSQDNDYLVFANGANASTIDHTSYSRGLVGLLDAEKSVSLHGISGAVNPNWTAAYSDTAAGRFNGQKWRRALDAIHDDGEDGAEVITLMDKGVRRDITAQYQAGVRFDDSMDMEIDGEPKARGKKFRGSKKVPPGTVHMFVKKSIKKKTIFDNTQQMPSWGNGKEIQDDSGWIFAIDWSGFVGHTSRKTLAYFQNQTAA